MGDVSILARRLPGGYVQHHWAGNGGCLDIYGGLILEEYTTPEDVEYLFGLGELARLSYKNSEQSDHWWKNSPTGHGSWVGASEFSVFDRMAFTDYIYFYESAEQKWYFISPYPMAIAKVPLEWCVDSMESMQESKDDRLNQNGTLSRIHLLTDEAMFAQLSEDDIADLCRSEEVTPADIEELRTQIVQAVKEDRTFDLDHLEDSSLARAICKRYDRWAVIDETGAVKLHRRTEQHIETINW